MHRTTQQVGNESKVQCFQPLSFENKNILTGSGLTAKTPQLYNKKL